MFIASLTLVPALLAIFGRGSFYPFIPRTPEMQAERARKRKAGSGPSQGEGEPDRPPGDNEALDRRPGSIGIIGWTRNVLVPNQVHLRSLILFP